MKNVARLIGRPEFHLWLFAVALMAFARPALTINLGARPSAVFLAYFAPWAVLVAVLATLASVSQRHTTEVDSLTTEVDSSGTRGPGE